MNSENRKQIVDIVLKHLPGVIGVYLFGSQVTGDTHAESDIDLALLAKSRLDPDLAFEIKSEISSQMRSNVDLVDLGRSDEVTNAQIVTYGDLLYSNTALQCAQFETVALSKYAILNEERAEILADIQKRGQIYGR